MSKEFEESITNFIDDRLSTEYHKLKVDKSYKSAKIKYDNAYNKLSDKQKDEIDELLGLYANLSSFENNFAYRLGMSDSISLLKYNCNDVTEH